MINDPADTMRKMIQVRQMQQQTELLRQQTEAMRQQNEQRQQYVAPVEPKLAAPQQPRSNDDGESTGGMVNCRAWKGWSEVIRVLYVVARTDAIIEVSTDLTKDPGKQQEMTSRYVPYYLNVGEIVEGTNHICGQPENTTVPVVRAIDALSLKTRGASPQAVEDALSANRMR